MKGEKPDFAKFQIFERIASLKHGGISDEFQKDRKLCES
jgi:hypothetical protein